MAQDTKIWSEDFVLANPKLAADAIGCLIELNEYARDNTLDEISKKIAAMPGDTAASIAIWIKEQKTISAPHPLPSDQP